MGEYPEQQAQGVGEREEQKITLNRTQVKHTPWRGKTAPLEGGGAMCADLCSLQLLLKKV